MNKKRVTQIIVLVVIVVIIAAIWIVKNTENDKKAGGGSSVDIQTPLQIDKIDMDEILSHGLPVIIDFGSDSCAPCKQMAPALEKVNADMQGKAIIHFADVWNSPQAAQDSQNFPFQVIPTQFFYTADGKPYVPSEDMPIAFTLYSHRETGEHMFTVHEGGLSEEQMLLILKDMGVD